MFGTSEAMERMTGNLDKSMAIISEALSKNTLNIVSLDDRSRKLESNLNVIAEYLGKNAPNIQNLPWESTHHVRAIDLAINTIDKQNEATGRSQELLNKWILANFKGNEQVQSSLNAIISAQGKTNQNLENLSKSLESLAVTFKEIGEFQLKTKAILEFLVEAIPSDSDKKQVKNPKLASLE